MPPRRQPAAQTRSSRRKSKVRTFSRRKSTTSVPETKAQAPKRKSPRVTKSLKSSASPDKSEPITRPSTRKSVKSTAQSKKAATKSAKIPTRSTKKTTKSTKKSPKASKKSAKSKKSPKAAKRSAKAASDVSESKEASAEPGAARVTRATTRTTRSTPKAATPPLAESDVAQAQETPDVSKLGDDAQKDGPKSLIVRIRRVRGFLSPRNNRRRSARKKAESTNYRVISVDELPGDETTQYLSWLQARRGVIGIAGLPADYGLRLRFRRSLLPGTLFASVPTSPLPEEIDKAILHELRPEAVPGTPMPNSQKLSRPFPRAPDEADVNLPLLREFPQLSSACPLLKQVDPDAEDFHFLQAKSENSNRRNQKRWKPLRIDHKTVCFAVHDELTRDYFAEDDSVESDLTRTESTLYRPKSSHYSGLCSVLSPVQWPTTRTLNGRPTMVKVPVLTNTLRVVTLKMSAWQLAQLLPQHTLPRLNNAADALSVDTHDSDYDIDDDNVDQDYTSIDIDAVLWLRGRFQELRDWRTHSKASSRRTCTKTAETLRCGAEDALELSISVRRFHCNLARTEVIVPNEHWIPEFRVATESMGTSVKALKINGEIGARFLAFLAHQLTRARGLEKRLALSNLACIPIRGEERDRSVPADHCDLLTRASHKQVPLSFWSPTDEFEASQKKTPRVCRRLIRRYQDPAEAHKKALCDAERFRVDLALALESSDEESDEDSESVCSSAEDAQKTVRSSDEDAPRKRRRSSTRAQILEEKRQRQREKEEKRERQNEIAFVRKLMAKAEAGDRTARRKLNSRQYRMLFEELKDEEFVCRASTSRSSAVVGGLRGRTRVLPTMADPVPAEATQQDRQAIVHGATQHRKVYVPHVAELTYDEFSSLLQEDTTGSRTKLVDVKAGAEDISDSAYRNRHAHLLEQERELRGADESYNTYADSVFNDIDVMPSKLEHNDDIDQWAVCSASSCRKWRLLSKTRHKMALGNRSFFCGALSEPCAAECALLDDWLFKCVGLHGALRLRHAGVHSVETLKKNKQLQSEIAQLGFFYDSQSDEVQLLYH
ncbi:MAG: hypothetical protein MHM6MM_001543 [Cercozoa sp. M6MM]